MITFRDAIKVTELFGASLPMDALFADLGATPDQVDAGALSDETLRHAVTATMTRLLETGVERENAIAMLRMTEPFRSNWPQTEALLEKDASGDATQ